MSNISQNCVNVVTQNSLCASDWIQLILAILTFLGIGVAIYSTNKQLRQQNKQLKMNTFFNYTKRYQEIILHFPENINANDFDYEELGEMKNKTLRYMRAYFDLCSEEYHLWKTGYIDDDIWKEWKEGIKFAFSKTAFKKGWEIIVNDTKYYTDFSEFIEDALKSKKNI